MNDTSPYILQLSDTVTTRKCAIRIDAEDGNLPLGALLDTFVKSPQTDRLLAQRRITPQSNETLLSLQELVYATTDGGLLQGILPGVLFRQDDEVIALDAVPQAQSASVNDSPVRVIDIAIDRMNAEYDRNWVGFHKRRWMKNDAEFSAFVLECLEAACGPENAQRVLQLSTPEDRMTLVRVLARRIWDSPFESYSRFSGRKLVYKSGDETVRNVMEGAGGICSEKVQALKFVTDHFGLQSEYVLAGANARAPIPEEKLRELLNTFDFSFTARYMRYWQHTALLYTIGDTKILVDGTNGNIPFLFLCDGAAESLLTNTDKQPVRVRMVDTEEEFYYHRVSQDIPEDLFFALEGWISHADLIQVFENELGLSISSEFFVTPVMYRNAKAFDKLRAEYVAVCQRSGLEYDIEDSWTLDSRLGQEFSEREPGAATSVLAAREHLVSRYNDWEGPGHAAGLAIIKISRGKASTGDESS